jgi:tRNA-specific 2-thiouridylase
MINEILSERTSNRKKDLAKTKVAVGLSGGVDSSVAALLLKERGYEVVGVYLECWDEKADGCSAHEDRVFAVKVAAKLGIRFVHLDFIQQYKSTVMKYFFDEYKAGRTPNPDVMCNKEIKFGMFYDWAMDNGYDYVATGHYARVVEVEGKYKLLAGVDGSKDQSYFLYLLDQEHLSHTLFPLGEMTKDVVRKIASEKRLPTATRPDSTGICFIGDIDVRMFLQTQIEQKKGHVTNTEGKIIGEHNGVWFYTIGQRHGFEIKKYQGVPMYVTGKDIGENRLIVGTYEQAKRSEFMVCDPHWITEDPFMNKEEIRCKVRIRHLGNFHDCVINKMDNNKLSVKIKEKVFGVAVGQSAVFYDEDTVLGGAVICY